MADFLDAFDVERSHLLRAVGRFEEIWGRFHERRALDVEGQDTADSLIASELAAVRDDLNSARFDVGIFGLIKRGKSTLLNALLGLEVSSMHVTPETAVPVYVEHGDDPEAQVHFADGSIRHVAVEEVDLYTSQKANPNNRLGVLHVQQRVPVGFLRNGVRLVDTPGLDDAEADEVYTERTLQELDSVHAGIVVFLSPPTVGATELGFLEQVVSRQLRKVFLVCNMFPQHFFDPQTRNDVLGYVGQRIVDASRRMGFRGEVRLYPVCALEAWQARQTGDIDRFKASGAARLLRDVEVYLSDAAGAETLRSAARRVAHAARLAEGEVTVRERLLDDPDLLAAYRSRLDGSVADLEREFDRALNSVLMNLDPLQMRVRGMVLAPFGRGKQALAACKTASDVEAFAAKFRREVEVSGEIASTTFQRGFAAMVERLRVTLQERFEAVLTDFSPNVPEVVLDSRAFTLTREQVQAARRADDGGIGKAIGGAAAGGLVSGGAALMLAGGVLGPLGLLAGALIGWKLGELLGGSRGLDKAKAEMAVRLDEVSRQLVQDFDQQVALQVTALRELVSRRRHAFASDLYEQFAVVGALTSDPERMRMYRTECERFVAAFRTCADSALRVAGLDDVPASMEFDLTR